MAQTKIAFVAALGSRTDLIKSLAPPEVEVTLIDLRLPEEEKKALCRDADAIISSQVSTEVLRQCPNVRLIQTLSAGFDRLDIEAIGEMGIPIANNGGANAIAVSEQTIALMIAVSKKTMLHWDTAGRQRQWRGNMRERQHHSACPPGTPRHRPARRPATGRGTAGSDHR